jgi:tRNA dimethylallyltransferase
MTSSNDASVVEEALRLALAAPGDLLTVVGPTASGKTSLAVALAERLGGEIISADSVQIYRGFDIGSGKPTALELARAPHHLVGTFAPGDPVDAVAWSRLAEAAIADVRARGRVPIVCGGTFLWVKALLFGLAEAPAASPEARERHRAIAESDGRPALHARLQEVDAETAARLHPNDFVRVSRALEVHELSGKPMSAWQREHGFARPRHRARVVAIACDPATLTERITVRAHAWLAAGWRDEVRALLVSGFGDARAMASVGYAQVRAALACEIDDGDLETTIVRATRVFARRQRTWLNHADVTWLGPTGSARQESL